MLDIIIYLQRLPILETLLSLRLWHKYQYSEDNNDIWYLIISLVIIIYAGEKTKIRAQAEFPVHGFFEKC